MSVVPFGPNDPFMRWSADDYDLRAAQAGLGAFTKRLFGPAWVSAPHIDRLQAALMAAATTPNSRVIVTMPPRHSKSLNVSEHLPAWYLGRYPENRIIAASHSAHLAYTFSRRVRNKLRHPRWPFPEVLLSSDKAAVTGWDIAGTRGGYMAVGVGGSPAGEGGNLIIIDDPIPNQAAAESPTYREALWEWYRGTIYTRLEPGGTIIVVATRWHDDDLTGRLLMEAAAGGEPWINHHMPAINDDNTALWPARWPVPALMRIKDAVGSRVFEAQYQGNPIEATGGTFKADWWRRYTHLPILRRVEVTCDSAFKTGAANDYSVFAAWGKDEYDNAYLLNVWRERLEFPDLIRRGYQCIAWADLMGEGKALLVVEDKASGQSAIQTWRAGNKRAIAVIGYPVPGDLSKVARAEAITPMVEGGRVFIPDDSLGHDWLDEWLTEHTRFPAGKHDDQVDTTTMAIDRLLMGGRAEWYPEVVGWFRDMGAA